MSRFIYAFICAVIFIFTSSCNSEKKERLALRINLNLEPTSLDPLHVRNQSSLFLVRHLHEGLYRYFNEEIKQALAASCEISQDKTTYTIHLKEATFSDGSKITAFDFIASLKRALLDDKCEYAHLLYIIKNAKNFRQTKDDKLELGICALNDSCLIYTLERPYQDFISLLTHPVFFPTKMIREEMLFSGPFILEEHVPQNKIKLRKNENYFNSDLVKINQIEGLILSHDTALALYEDGQLDYIGSPLGMIPQEALDHLNKNNKLIKKPWLGMCFLRVNTDRIDQEVREALASSIDQSQIVHKALNGHHLPAYTFLPMNFGLECKKSAFKDNFKAQSISSTTRPLTLKFSSSDIRMQNVACLIKSQIESKLGIPINLIPRESKMLLQEQSMSDFDLHLGSWIADTNDPENFLEIFSEKNLIVNGTNWQNGRFKDLLQIAKFHPEKRKVCYEQAQNLLLEECPVIPLFQFNLIYAKDQFVEDFSLNSLGILDFSFANLKR